MPLFDSHCVLRHRSGSRSEIKAIARSYSSFKTFARDEGTFKAMISAVCAAAHSMTVSKAGDVFLGCVGCSIDFFLKILVKMYGDAQRNRLEPGSVR